MDNKTNNSGGVGFCGLLTIVFIALKLTNYINWSWLWILSPTWIPILLGVIIIAIVTLFKIKGER